MNDYEWSRPSIDWATKVGCVWGHPTDFLLLFLPNILPSFPVWLLVVLRFSPETVCTWPFLLGPYLCRCYVQMWIHICVHVIWRSKVNLICWDSVAHCDLGLWDKTRLIGLWTPESICPRLSSARSTSVCHCTHLLNVGSGNQTQVLTVYGKLIIELFLQPWLFHFFLFINWTL